MLFSRLKSWPKWRPCCLLHFNLTKALGTRFASISNRPRFSCRAQDPGDSQHEVWRENLTNQMTESLFPPEYKFVFTVNFLVVWRKSRSKMPKRQFPFDGASPLQLKTYVNAFHFEKANNMDGIYGRYWRCRIFSTI